MLNELNGKYIEQFSQMLKNIRKEIAIEEEQRIRKELRPRASKGEGKYYFTVGPFGQNTYIVEVPEHQYKIIQESEDDIND